MTLDGARLILVLLHPRPRRRGRSRQRTRCPPRPTAGSRRSRSSWRWTSRHAPSWPAGRDSCASSRPTTTHRAREGAALGDLGGALLALPVLLGQVHALQALLLLLWLPLPPFLLAVALVAIGRQARRSRHPPRAPPSRRWRCSSGCPVSSAPCPTPSCAVLWGAPPPISWWWSLACSLAATCSRRCRRQPCHPRRRLETPLLLAERRGPLCR